VHLDQGLFHFLNATLSCGPLDKVFLIATDKAFYFGVAAATFFLLPAAYRKPGLYVALAALAALVVADATAAQIWKPLFHRSRPCYELPAVRLLIDQVDSPGFPSNHAANVFAFATVILIHYRRIGWPLVVIGALVAYSRIYVGVHYPADVVAGALWGILVGIIFISLHFYATALGARWAYLARRRRALAPK
jgi:undecaprenyl-diphosphatase